MATRREPRTAVVALGGNAITGEGQRGTYAEIVTNCQTMARAVCALVSAGWRVVVIHGNGPQVGNLSLQQAAGEPVVPGQPLATLVAMTQGWLGGLIELCLRAEGGADGPEVATLVTHVSVDPADPAFDHPTKPIGPFYSREEADHHVADSGWSVVEDSGRGFRRVVASPRPLAIVQAPAIATLLRAGFLVIGGGGGGVPVVSEAGTITGIDAVIDKDRAAAILAADIDADALVLVTGVDAVQIDYGTTAQRPLHDVGVDELRQHLASGQFPPGSMGPKVEAALSYLDRSAGTAVITSATVMADALAGRGSVGTRIVREAVLTR